LQEENFDLIVIGSGSGLDVANAAASQEGLKVAIIEKDIRRANIFGINTDNFSVDFEKIVKRVNNMTDANSEAIRKSYQNLDNPKLFSKECRFVGEKKIAFKDDETTTVTSDKILIASGTTPRIPEIKGLKESRFITSDEALRLRQQPRILTFIGGGYITCELAHFYGSLGTEINIIQLRNILIPYEDKEISQKFTEVFFRRYNVYLGYS
jgi:mycothione reductase